MKVLIVGGSRERRKSMVDALGQLTNIVVQGAVAGVQTALYAVANARPDLVITDAELPDGEGAHLVAKIRGLVRSPSVVVVTESPNDEQRQRYLAAGVELYISGDPELRNLQDAVISLGRSRSSIAVDDSLRLLGRMTAAIIHDGNNYLTAIDMTVLMLRRYPDDEALWTTLRRALDATARLNSTLLAYARGAPPEPQEIDLSVLVRDMLSTFATLIPASVHVTTELAYGVRGVHGVASELEQVVLNLVLNACDSMPDGGALHIAVTRTASAAVRLRVADSGHGPDIARGTSRRGLGLGITNAVIEKHRGVMRLAPRPGGGSIVDVMLPAD